MPIGAIIDSLAVAFGGMLGAFAGKWLKNGFKENMNLIFGLCSIAMGISNIVLMKNMPAVMFSVIIGTSFGLAMKLEKTIMKVGELLQRCISLIRPAERPLMSQMEYNQQLLTVIVLFCASGTGIYGAIVSGLNGDHTVLIAKAILDCFTALIMACTLGRSISLIAIPQFIVLYFLFLCGKSIFPLTTPAMIDDFKAVGGILLVATGYRIIKVKMFPTADMILAMVIAMPVSWCWTELIFPLLM